MADTKISALTAATAAAGANEIGINEAGTSKKLTVDQIRDYCGVRYVNLTANATANATTTAARITSMDCTSVGTGNYAFRYYIRYQSSATTTGVKFSVNHTGTLTFFLCNMTYVDVSATASTGAASQAANASTAQVYAAYSARAKSAAAGMGPTLSVDALNTDMLCILEGSFLVTVSGTLELYHASETAVSTTVMAGTGLVLHRMGA